MTVLPTLCVSLFLVGVFDAASVPAVSSNGVKDGVTAATNSTATVCPPNEEKHFCVAALCRGQSCAQQGIPIPCASVSRCDEGCVCVFGTLRNEEGVCVPENQCPGAKTCPENEEFSVCTELLCRHQKCELRNERPPCPYEGIEDDACTKGCVCVQGMLRNDKGVCVPEEQC